MKSKALLLLVVASQLTCHQVIFHAPPDTVMTCFANPEDIPAVNGVSIISCLLVEDVGTPVADGTTVQFFTTLGRIPEQGKTNDGVVRVNFQSDGRSGTASITAVSGGDAAPPVTTSPTTSTPGSTTPGGGPVRSSGALSASALSGAGALQNTDAVTVRIGNINARELVLTAFPLRLTDSRTSQITATVFDGAGNLLSGVPVFFEVAEFENLPGPTPVPGTPTPTPSTAPTATPTPRGGTGEGLEHMDSQGQPVFTDSNGQARDVLRTRYPREAPQRRVTVRAFVPSTSAADDVVVIVN